MVSDRLNEVKKQVESPTKYRCYTPQLDIVLYLTGGTTAQKRVRRVFGQSESLWQAFFLRCIRIAPVLDSPRKAQGPKAYLTFGRIPTHRNHCSAVQRSQPVLFVFFFSPVCARTRTSFSNCDYNINIYKIIP